MPAASSSRTSTLKCSVKSLPDSRRTRNPASTRRIRTPTSSEPHRRFRRMGFGRERPQPGSRTARRRRSSHTNFTYEWALGVRSNRDPRIGIGALHRAPTAPSARPHTAPSILWCERYPNHLPGSCSRRSADVVFRPCHTQADLAPSERLASVACSSVACSSVPCSAATCVKAGGSAHGLRLRSASTVCALVLWGHPVCGATLPCRAAMLSCPDTVLC